MPRRNPCNKIASIGRRFCVMIRSCSSSYNNCCGCFNRLVNGEYQFTCRFTCIIYCNNSPDICYLLSHYILFMNAYYHTNTLGVRYVFHNGFRSRPNEEYESWWIWFIFQTGWIYVMLQVKRIFSYISSMKLLFHTRFVDRQFRNDVLKVRTASYQEYIKIQRIELKNNNLQWHLKFLIKHSSQWSRRGCSQWTSWRGPQNCPRASVNWIVNICQ